MLSRIYGNFEIIILEDSSTDRSLKTCQQLDDDKVKNLDCLRIRKNTEVQNRYSFHLGEL
ncbi:MAG: hypothetical protein WBF90_02795 [Rivularia sp. (in: cyanobacteria)]